MTAQTGLILADNARSYPEELMQAILPAQVVCGEEKDSYKLSCYKGGVKSISVDYALAYKYLRYATTFKRHNKPYAEIIKCFVIDIDYKFKSNLDDAHRFVTDNIIPPTFSTETDKGYQFIIGLAAPFILTDAGETVARKYNEGIMKLFTNAGIDIDQGASARLVGTFRNPLVHNFKYHNKLYNVSELSKRLPEEIKTLRIEATPRKSTVTAGLSKSDQTTGQNDEKLQRQKDIIDNGFIEGNRNEYFYLTANKAAVLANLESYSEALMICRGVAEKINSTKISIKDSEVKSTAAQLWRYKKKNQLFMPRVFSTYKQKENAGRYRLELNATIGFVTLQERRSATAKLINRDRKAKTHYLISEAISDMNINDFVLESNQRVKTIYKRIAKKASINVSTVIRHISKTPSLLSSKIDRSKREEIKNVLDCMPPFSVCPTGTVFEGITAKYAGIQETKEKAVELYGDRLNSIQVLESEVILIFNERFT